MPSNRSVDSKMVANTELNIIPTAIRSTATASRTARAVTTVIEGVASYLPLSFGVLGCRSRRAVFFKVLRKLGNRLVDNPPRTMPAVPRASSVTQRTRFVKRRSLA